MLSQSFLTSQPNQSRAPVHLILSHLIKFYQEKNRLRSPPCSPGGTACRLRVVSTMTQRLQMMSVRDLAWRMIPHSPRNSLTNNRKPSEKSEIEEALSIKESNASGRSPQIEAPHKDKLEIPPGKSLDTSPSYSADFEVSSVQENFSIKSVKSSPEDKESVEAVSPAYTSEFEKEASAKGAPSSLYTPDFEGSVSSRDRLTRDGFTAGDLVSSSNKKSSVRDEVRILICFLSSEK